MRDFHLPPAPSRLGTMASTSSMKTMDGAAADAAAKSWRNLRLGLA